MTVDADITVEILRGLRQEMQEMRAEMREGFASFRTDIDELRTEMRTGFSELRDDIGALQLRMGTVERVVVAFSRELAHLVGRVDKLETRPT